MENGQIDKPTDIHSRSDFIVGFLSTPGKKEGYNGEKGRKKFGRHGKCYIYRKKK